MNRLVIPSAAFLWGLQFAFLNPALALLLATLFHLEAAEVGGVLVLYNASGFLAALVVPVYADRKLDYLRPMIACGVLTVALAVLLATVPSVPVAAIGLVVLGGPATVGISLLFAQLKQSGAGLSTVMNTRAYVSLAWVAGPPLATVIMTSWGSRATLLAIAVVAVLSIASTTMMLPGRTTTAPAPATAVTASVGDPRRAPTMTVVLIVIAFIILQATNYTVVTVMSLYVTGRLQLDVIWAGISLGVAAGLEIPALVLIGRMGGRYSSTALIISGCAAGVVYYLAMTFVSGPILLVGLQVLNAWFFAAVAGVGLALFQDIIPAPGLAAGLYTNTRRVGAIAGGPIISFGSATSLGYSGIFAACAALTALALAVVIVAGGPAAWSMEIKGAPDTR